MPVGKQTPQSDLCREATRLSALVVVWKKETIVHHEVGHAVIARVLDIPVSYAPLNALDGASAVVTRS
jgi:hypothetical protein